MQKGLVDYPYAKFRQELQKQFEGLSKVDLVTQNYHKLFFTKKDLEPVQQTKKITQDPAKKKSWLRLHNIAQDEAGRTVLGPKPKDGKTFTASRRTACPHRTS